MDIYAAVLWISELRRTYCKPCELDLPHAVADFTDDTVRYNRLKARSNVCFSGGTS